MKQLISFLAACLLLASCSVGPVTTVSADDPALVEKLELKPTEWANIQALAAPDRGWSLRDIDKESAGSLTLHYVLKNEGTQASSGPARHFERVDGVWKRSAGQYSWAEVTR